MENEYLVLSSAQFIYSSKYCFYELPIFIEGQGCAICFQISKYLKRYEILMLE